MIRVALFASAVAALAAPASASLINNELNQGWASFRDLTSAEFSAKFAEFRDAGYRMIDIDAYPNGSGVLYSQVWENNSDNRGWAEYRDMTSAQYATRWADLRDAGYRPHDFEVLSERLEPALRGHLVQEYGEHRLVLEAGYDQLAISARTSPSRGTSADAPSTSRSTQRRAGFATRRSGIRTSAMSPGFSSATCRARPTRTRSTSRPPPAIA